MKTIYRVSIILNIFFAGYILIRGGELLVDELFYRNENLAREEYIYSEKEMTETTASQGQVTCDTVYSVSEYDLSTGRQEVYQQLLPENLIGMNRTQLIQWIDEYNQSPTLEDLEKGFCSMELLSFSPTEIRVRKRVESVSEAEIEQIEQPKQLHTQDTVSGNSLIYGCILSHEGLLTVYDGMRRHVILYTDISLFDLSEEEQQEILDGKEVYSEQELYHLLENYSS